MNSCVRPGAPATASLEATASRRKFMRIVEERGGYLDELERRNPAAFAAWLASGATAAGNPLPYLSLAAHRPRGHQLGRTHRRAGLVMSRLHRLFDEQGQSPWLDNLTRPYLRDGTLADLVARGVRGVTANPTIVAKAIEASDAYDDQFEDLLSAGRNVEDAYWELALTDVADALQILRPTFHHSGGDDGFVSIEVAPQWARDIEATIADARYLYERIHQPNLLVKVPATSEGVHAIEALIGEGRNVNVTLHLLPQALPRNPRRLPVRAGDIRPTRR